jgi:hypothetical protein
MPGVYKLKNCKFCSKEHRKKGPYCGQSCASKDKEPTEAMREAMRQVATEYNQTPEAAAKRRQFGTSLATMNGDDFAVDIPTIQDLDELPPGYDRGENW